MRFIKILGAKFGPKFISDKLFGSIQYGVYVVGEDEGSGDSTRIVRG